MFRSHPEMLDSSVHAKSRDYIHMVPPGRLSRMAQLRFPEGPAPQQLLVPTSIKAKLQAASRSRHSRAVEMPALRQRNLVCFYCGGKSPRKQDGSVRRWKCTRCDAVNYLDESGHVADPPAEEGNDTTQYALPRGDQAGATAASTEDSLFCATCLKNQHLLNETLASYLPPADHPDYAAFEASYPDYRKNLEVRYPQVCVGCEPRVRARIRAAGYVAKTDHLRRMIEHTRGAGPRRGWQDCGWRGVLIFLGGLAWWGSLVGNVVWHALGTTAALVGPRRIHAYPVLGHAQQYVRQLLGKRDDPSGVCTMIQWSLILGVASIWWNTQLMAKLRRSGSRLTGLNEYYKLQAATATVRASAWWVLREGSTVALEPAQVGAAHLFMLFFVVGTAVIAARAVRLNPFPPVTFHEPDRPLVEPATGQSRMYSDGHGNSAVAPYQSGTPTRQEFPLHKLSSNTPRTQDVASAYRPPTPPPEDEDVMDWTPSQEEFRPTRQALPAPAPAPLPTAPFSTYNALPPAPRAPAAQLRNPIVARPQQPRPDEAPPENPFGRYRGSPESGGIGRPASAGRPEMVVHPPRFFARDDQDTATTLQKLFDMAFNINDEPVEVQRAVSDKRDHGQQSGGLRGGVAGAVQATSGSASLVFCVLEVALVAGATCAWISSSSSSKLWRSSATTYFLRVVSVGIATTSTSISVSRQGQTPGLRAGMLVSSAQLVAAVVLTPVTCLPSPPSETTHLATMILLMSILATRVLSLLFFRQPTGFAAPASGQGQTYSQAQSQIHSQASSSTFPPQALDQQIGSPTTSPYTAPAPMPAYPGPPTTASIPSLSPPSFRPSLSPTPSSLQPLPSSILQPPSSLQPLPSSFQPPLSSLQQPLSSNPPFGKGRSRADSTSSSTTTSSTLPPTDRRRSAFTPSALDFGGLSLDADYKQRRGAYATPAFHGWRTGDGGGDGG